MKVHRCAWGTAVAVQEKPPVTITPGPWLDGAYVRCGRFQVYVGDAKPRALRRAARKVRKQEAEAQRLEGL